MIVRTKKGYRISWSEYVGGNPNDRHPELRIVEKGKGWWPVYCSDKYLETLIALYGGAL